MSRPLSPKQLKFVERYLAGDSAVDAYVKAGYKGKAKSGAAQLLENTGIKAAIDAARDKALKANEVSAEWCIRRMQEEADFHGEGASHSARVKAIELLGRMFALFPNNLEHSGPKGKPIKVDLSKVSDADLDTLDTIIGAAEEPADEGAGSSGEGAS